MITLITAVPGSGKTLYCIKLILAAAKEGRPIYANINGLNIPNVQVHPAPDDWRDTPHGSLVIYDECQQPHLYPSNAKPGIVTDERLTAMETHRHSGHDLVFVTQAPTFVHHHIRKLVGEHIHLYRPNGVQGANLYRWGFTCDHPNDREEQKRADHELWKYPKEFYGYYTSATVHTHKMRFPKKIGILAGLILVGVLWVMYSFSNGSQTWANISGMNEAVNQPAVTSPPLPAAATSSSQYAWSSSPKVTPVAGCIANEARTWCQCFDREGHTIDLEHARCLSVISRPLPRGIVSGQGGRSS